MLAEGVRRQLQFFAEVLQMNVVTKTCNLADCSYFVCIEASKMGTFEMSDLWQ